jgi:hypothetical protein
MDVFEGAAVKQRACECCRFWRRQRDTKFFDWGECRRIPPGLPPIEEDKLVHVGLWPHTAKNDWCGEWDDATPTDRGNG